MRYNRDFPEYGNEYGAYPGTYPNEYGRRGRDSRGRYTTRNNGRGRYRGEDMMEEMQKRYGDYSEAKEEMEMGNYGAKNDTMKSLDCMLESMVDFIAALKKDANSQEEIELIKEYSKQIGEI